MFSAKEYLFLVGVVAREMSNDELEEFMAQANVAAESNKDVVIRLMKRGGFVLVAGGGVNDLSEKIRTHPQIILWDDNDQGVE